MSHIFSSRFICDTSVIFTGYIVLIQYNCVVNGTMSSSQIYGVCSLIPLELSTMRRFHISYTPMLTAFPIFPLIVIEMFVAFAFEIFVALYSFCHNKFWSFSIILNISFKTTSVYCQSTSHTGNYTYRPAHATE